MPVPTRPSTGGPIESSWGQETHDGVFTPAGGEWVEGAGVGDAVPMLMVTATDPSEFLPGGAGDTLIVPTDGDGLYELGVNARCAASAGTLYLNMSITGSQTLTLVDQGNAIAGVTHVSSGATLMLAAGDQIQVSIDANAATGCTMTRITLTRIGAGWGLA